MLREQADPCTPGSEPRPADYVLAPILFSVSLTPEADKIITGKVTTRWGTIEAVERFGPTAPDPG